MIAARNDGTSNIRGRQHADLTRQPVSRTASRRCFYPCNRQQPLVLCGQHGYHWSKARAARWRKDHTHTSSHRPGRRMVSLGKVTAPKPINLPSQRYGAEVHVEVVGTHPRHRRENNGLDPSVNLVSKCADCSCLVQSMPTHANPGRPPAAYGVQTAPLRGPRTRLAHPLKARPPANSPPCPAPAAPRAQRGVALACQRSVKPRRCSARRSFRRWALPKTVARTSAASRAACPTAAQTSTAATGTLMTAPLTTVCLFEDTRPSTRQHGIFLTTP